jgi:hypothetical protein
MVAVLFAGFGSGWSAETVELSVTDAALAAGMTAIDTVAAAPFASVPRLQLTAGAVVVHDP